MRLSEHPEFEQAVIRAANHFSSQGLRPAFIEKDYYVTEALRAIAQAAGNKVIFKGGTSLSKGWSLIQRFSEDIDLFLDPQAFEPPLGAKAIDRELKKLRDSIIESGQVTFLKDESKTFGGSGRNDWFAYDQKFGGQGEVAGRILLEAGIASGRQPIVTMELQSYLGQFLKDVGLSLGAEDENPFSMQLLHFRRTFVEKMFAIHKRVELFKKNGIPIGSYARHYYDLSQLAPREEVLSMLKSDEYAIIKADYDRISRAYFPDHYSYPTEMSFANSEALFPPAELSKVIGRQYHEQCTLLCYGPYPEWSGVMGQFEKLRTLL